MNDIIDIIKNANWQTIIAMFAVVWYYTKDLKSEMKAMHADMQQQGKRIDNLYQICIDLLKEKKS